MNMIKTVVALCTALFLLGGQAVLADSKDEGAVKEIANIVMHLNHHPSDAEKARLKDIINNGSVSANVHAIASALLNMEHRATAGDKKKLGMIAQDSSADEDVRTLADIVHNLEHKPSGGDKAKLKDIAD